MLDSSCQAVSGKSKILFSMDYILQEPPSLGFRDWAPGYVYPPNFPLRAVQDPAPGQPPSVLSLHIFSAEKHILRIFGLATCGKTVETQGSQKKNNRTNGYFSSSRRALIFVKSKKGPVEAGSCRSS